MAKNKNCLVFETLGKVTDMELMESQGDGAIRLHGVFGVCGVKNGNNRIYNKENYGRMVESLQKVIATDGCLGELEHPNTMNINLDNVSHKIESIQMDESGTITGTIRLLDTVKGKNAQAIVEAGCPLYISSRGAGSIDEAGNVTLNTIKTYDLVGTPGFSQAKLTALKSNQKFESLNESLAIIVEEDESDDDLLSSNDDPQDDDKKKDDEKEDKDKDSKEDKDKDEEPKEDPKPDDENKKDNKDNNNTVTMEEIKSAIDKLSEKVTSLEAELHVAQESLENVKPVNYDAIEKWVNSEFKSSIMEDFENKLTVTIDDKIEESQESMAHKIQDWISEEYTPNVERWINEEFAGEIEKWICEQYSPVVQEWVTEHYNAEVVKAINESADEVKHWVGEDYSDELQKWISEEYSGTLQNWINEEFAPETKESILNEANQNISEFMESQKSDRLNQIDKMLESIDSLGGGKDALDKIIKEERQTSKYKGVYVVENMPSQYQPVWNTLSEAKQQEIIRSSRAYDFTKEGVLEKFWANADLSDKLLTENKDNKSLEQNSGNTFYESVARRMNTLRGII